ncbi:MAG: hypothetical protein H6843_17060 [Rhodospirillaceae bacterium]|nr:hypothetical protein [Rhodospirillaceae bacterium]
MADVTLQKSNGRRANGHDANASVAATCRDTAAIAGKAVSWITDNPDKVRQEQSALLREFRKFGTAARKLEAAVHRPMCVGVFGPSQAGKSYLISALARQGTAPLIADFDGVPDGLDFVREINPEGGQESTGLVTRFTIRRERTPKGFPVALRLLSQTDVIKILGNTFFSDCDLSEEEVPSPQKVRGMIRDAEAQALREPVDVLNEEDVWDLQEYFEKYFKGEAIIKALGPGYWNHVAEVAPRLPIGARAALFSVLWGGIPEFTELLTLLYDALSGLGFASDAYCPIEGLVPRDNSIIDVRTLGGLSSGGDSAGSLDVVSPEGHRVKLPRAQITALTAELRIVVRDKPWDFFDHTDLLDFPGARSRENIPDIRAFLEQPTALQSLFLRGKVAYLFERYCAEQELTSMLLCIGPSNQEVRTLPSMVNDWIASTHGSEAAARARQQCALFLVLTKFDAEFEEKAGQAETSEGRWTTRMQTSLLDFFGKSSDWPTEWAPGEPFHNCYWLRNPNYKAKHILDYDASGREVGMRPGEEARIARYRRDYVSNETVRAHFANPERAWDEAFRLNDGGITYLADSLAPVCNPDIKRRQIEHRVAAQRALMMERLSRYHVSDDLQQELDRRRQAAANAVRRLAQCVQAQRFGKLIRAMQLDGDLLAGLYYQVETGAPGAEEDEDRPPPTIGPTVAADDLLADVFGDELDMVMANESTAPPPTAPRDHAGAFADAVLERWMEELHSLAETPQLYRYFQMSEATMGTLAAELISGARRLELRDTIARTVRKTTSFRQKLDIAMNKPALIAANLLNDFVNYVGFDAMPVEDRPAAGKGPTRRPVFAPRPPTDGELVLPETQTPYDRLQYVDWMAAFVRMVEQNAMSREGREIDVAQNARIGELVQALDRPVVG